MITSIVGGLNGRKVELADYMAKIVKPESAKKDINEVVEELKKEKVSGSITEAIKEYHPENRIEDFKTLFHFINIDNLDRAINELTASYHQLCVNLIITLGIKLRTWY